MKNLNYFYLILVVIIFSYSFLACDNKRIEKNEIILTIAEFPTDWSGDSTLINIFNNGEYYIKYGNRDITFRRRIIKIENEKEKVVEEWVDGTKFILEDNIEQSKVFKINKSDLLDIKLKLKIFDGLKYNIDETLLGGSETREIIIKSKNSYVRVFAYGLFFKHQKGHGIEVIQNGAKFKLDRVVIDVFKKVFALSPFQDIKSDKDGQLVYKRYKVEGQN